MEQKNEKQPSLLKQLFVFAGNYKYLSILSVFFAGISALAALVPFYCICWIMHEVLRVKPDFSKAEGIFSYGWHTVGFALPGMLFVLLYHHPPTLTTTLMRYAYAGEPQFQLKDALTFFMYLLVVSGMYDPRLRCRIFPRLSQPIPSANVWMRFFPARNRPVNPLWITRDMTSLSELQIKS